ncbi:hypothetical protein J0H58_09235 [bacterium]|nr:hypothetical protein [bacterium]
MPRSPSRDRSDRFTGFRGYVREPDRYARAKSAALLSAGVLVGLWLVVEAAHPRAAAFHTHGELANPHAAWDQNCAACHKQHGISDFSLSTVLNAQDRWHDLTCTKCHAGPSHHQTMDAEGVAFHDKCSNCHHDHAGRTASLTRIADHHCVRCHENLPGHTSGPTNYEKTVTSFASAHPEFKALRDYPPGTNYAPRKLKFSHAVHMFPGMGTGMSPDRIRELSGDDAARRYGEIRSKTPVALACASCHQLDAQVPTAADPPGESRQQFDQISLLLRGQPRAAVQPPRAAGAYYLPVNYDAHCKACHPTGVPGGAVGGGDNALNVAGFLVPHRLQMTEAEPLVRGGFWAQLAKASPAVAKAKLPGGRLDPAPAPDVTATFGGEIDRLTRTALAWMVADPEPAKAEDRPAAQGVACAKCHAFTGEGKAAKVEALPQHTVWFAHARFNHVSHRGLTCAECHPGTGPFTTAPPPRPNETEPVAILGVKSCQACHAPAGTRVEQADKTTTTAAGVRHGCTDCHRYHNGDRPLHGLGSPVRDPHTPQTLADFLSGGKK